MSLYAIRVLCVSCVMFVGIRASPAKATTTAAPAKATTTAALAKATTTVAAKAKAATTTAAASKCASATLACQRAMGHKGKACSKAGKPGSQENLACTCKTYGTYFKCNATLQKIAKGGNRIPVCGGMAPVCGGQPVCQHFPTISPSSKCAGPHDKVYGMSQQDFINNFMEGIGKGVINIIENHPSFKADLEARGQCQWDCVGQILTKATAPMLFSEIGVQNPSRHVLQEAIIGAFKACYPSAPRKYFQAVATKIIASGGLKTHVHATGENPVNAGKCPGGPPGAPKEAGVKFMQFADNHLEASFGKTISDKKFAALMVKILATPCAEFHSHCLATTLKLATTNLWMSGTLGQGDGDSMSVDAFTGAFKACFPRIPHAEARDFIDAVLKNIDHELDEVTRLYPSVGIPYIKARQATTANAISMFTLGAVGSAVFAVGMLSGAFVLRRMGGNARTLQTEDQGLE